MALKRIIVIVGPTAVGKSQAAVALAQRIKGEIISCDAMQVYKEIAIATNRPSQDILERIPHHLIGTVSVKEEFNAALFRKKVNILIRQIHQRNKIPIIVGGTGLYLKAVLDGIFEGPAKNEILRKKLEREAEKEGSEKLHHRLKKVDPVSAARIHPHDKKRIIRALEIYELTKKPISQLQKGRQGIWGEYDIRLFALNKDRNDLYRTIDDRVDAMFQQGLVEEIKKHSTKKLSKTAQSIIGFKELKGVFDGTYDIEHAKYLIKRNTRRYAKRQLTWFRADKRLQWILLNGNVKIDSVAQTIIGEMKRHGRKSTSSNG